MPSLFKWLTYPVRYVVYGVVRNAMRGVGCAILALLVVGMLAAGSTVGFR